MLHVGLLVGGAEGWHIVPCDRQQPHSEGVQEDHVVAHWLAERLLPPTASHA